MYDKCYLTTTDYDGRGPRLIGEITRKGINDYEFKYSYTKGLPGTPLIFQVRNLNDLSRTYGTQDVIEHVFAIFFNPPSHFRYKTQFKLFGIPEDSETWIFFENAYTKAEQVNKRGVPFVCSADGNHRLYAYLPGNVVIN